MRNFAKYKIGFILIICFQCLSQAQVSRLNFEQINYDEDFSPSMISSLVQTKKGFIWIGTENGLFRYDGYSFDRYVRDKNEGSLSNNHVNVIFEDNEGDLWIGTNHGVNRFNKDSNTFSFIDISPTKGGRNYISSFVEDGNNNVWVGTFGGVKKLNKNESLLEKVSNDSNFILNRSRVLSLFYDEDYGILMGTAQGLQAFNPETNLLNTLPNAFQSNPEFLKAKIWKIVKESNGDLWFGTETMGVFKYAKDKDVLIQFVHNAEAKNSISSNWINDIITIDEHTIWFATQNGLDVYDKKTETFTKYKHNALNTSSLTDNNLQCFLKDRDDCLWIGTKSGAINFYNKANSNFTNIGETVYPNFGLNHTVATAVIAEGKTDLWVGTYGGGLTHLNFKLNVSSHYMVNEKAERKTKNLITALAKKNEEHLICGTFNGLFDFDKNSKTFTSIPLAYEGSKANERPITSLIVDKDIIWVGTDGNGLKKILPDGTIENYLADASPGGLSDNFIIDLENRTNGIWISTQNGLNYFDKALNKVTKIYKTTTQPSIGNNSLTALFTDSKGRLWIGGDYDGLFYFDEASGRFSVLNKDKGFTNASIHSIAEDAEGNLWVSSEDFLFRIKFNNSSEKVNFNTAEISKFSGKDGVSVKQFSRNASVLFNEKQLVFGAVKGITIFDPSIIYKAPNENEIVLTTLIVNNEIVESSEDNSILQKPISETSNITINYDQGYIGLEFSSLNFINPRKSKYAYKLDDDLRNDNWHNTGTQNRINLSNLNPGDYLLSIKSTIEDGSWNPNIKTLEITVLPPWWKTWWANLVYLLLFILLVLIIVKFINNRVKLKRKLFLEHVESERKQEMLNMQLNFFTNISHEIRTPLTLIKGPIEELLENSDNTPKSESKLKTIKQNSDRLLKLVNELLDFRKAEKGHMRIYCEEQDIVAFCFEIYESFKGLAAKKNIEYNFVLNSNSIKVFFDKNQMEKVVYNLLSNAFKFTKKNGKIVFAVEQIYTGNKKVLIKIKDNGIGVPEANKSNIFNRFFQVDDRGVHNMGSGVGLALSKSIVELHKGKLVLEEEKESWANTVFQIELLLGKAHLDNDQVDDDELNLSKTLIDADSNAKTPVPAHENFEFEYTAYDPDKKTIFTVEDNDEVRKFIADVLIESYNVLDFSSAKEAVSYMDKEIPDLIVSDIMMPEMDGLQFCKYIKTNESTNHIPVILLTAKASVDNKVEGLSIGADAYISKPFSTKVLLLSVQNLLKSKEIFRQKYSGNFIVDSDLDKLTTPEELFLKKLMKIIEENLENPDFDVSMLVDKIGMSRTILYKKVNSLTNHSVASLIKQLRLKKAADIILKTTYPISEIAFMVGFNDRKHFSREFKKIYNHSPSAYKKLQSEAEN